MSDLTRETFFSLYRSAAEGVPCLGSLPADPLSDETAEKFFRIADRLIDNGRRFNLTAILEPAEIVRKHILDSLIPLALMIEQGIPVGEGVGANEILDVGTGAGFPLLPWAAVLPGDGVTLTGLDATGKKIAHIRESAKYAGLSNVRAVQARAEDAARGPMRESFPIVTARAVASMPVLLELCAPFAARAGFFAALKAKSADEEIASAARAAKELGLGEPDILRYTLPGGDERCLVLYKKRAATPRTYPRAYAEIAKHPLV
ncbi:MAG: 16S rRNA (guanine(527)-N(7))-methyltransferase RsmG [Ruminococcaceae bacterium]|jgi:16S rRNA (guanine(527)-N(7))-methyltransferase RsmG|nr:16S rRNA (guanine(527)-N(7))-methyltransferase RsmG [Oscillospiraceae bacterium]